MTTYDHWSHDDILVQKINTSLETAHKMRNGIIKDQIYYRLLNKADKIQNGDKRNEIKDKINKALEDS